MGKFSRDKGRRFELACYHLAEAYGLPVDPTFLQQTSQLADKPDLTIAGHRAECKHRENINMDLWRWLEGHRWVFLKRNRQEALCVMRLKDLLEMLARERGLPLPPDDVKLEDPA